MLLKEISKFRKNATKSYESTVVKQVTTKIKRDIVEKSYENSLYKLRKRNFKNSYKLWELFSFI